MHIDNSDDSIDYGKSDILLGAAELHQLPDDRGIEVAFAGRSNAGKSSALNKLTGQRNLLALVKRRVVLS